jgi:hypothetical protein
VELLNVILGWFQSKTPKKSPQKSTDSISVPSNSHHFPSDSINFHKFPWAFQAIFIHFPPFSTQAAPWLPGIRPARGSPAARRGEAKGPGDALLGAAEM